jgi:hypothetical protein
VVIVGGSWILILNQELHLELDRAQADNARIRKDRDALAQQVAKLTTQAPVVSANNGQETEVAHVDRPPLAGEVLKLTPNPIERGPGEVPTVYLPVRGRSVNFRLAFEWEANATYNAVVRTPEGDVIFTANKGFLSEQGAAGKSLVLRVPSGLLQPEDYTVTLYKRSARSTNEEVASYTFRARTK